MHPDTHAALAERFFSLDPELIAAPWPLFAAWREAGPVVALPEPGGWVVTDYALASQVLRDAESWSSAAVDGPVPAELEQWIAELAEEEPDLRELLDVPLLTILAADPPDHTRLRRALVGHLSAARIRTLAPLVDRVVAELLPPLLSGEEVDVVAALSLPLPAAVVGELLGIPAPERAWFVAQASAASTTNPHLETRAALRERLHAELALKRGFAALLDGTPPEGSLMAAFKGDVDRARLTEREALGLCREVIVAGSETTADHLSAVVLLLAREPALLGRLRADAGARETLVEEALRLESPFAGFWRRATRPVTLAGTELAQNSLLLIPFGALNRDPTRFEEPDRVDLDRATARRHLAFGQGIHFCVGAPLARLQSERVLHALVPRLDAVELVREPTPLDYHRSAQSRGLRTLRVRCAAGA